MTFTSPAGVTAAYSNVSITGSSFAAADTTPPVVQSITTSGSPAANAAPVTYTVTFDEAANNISTDDFELTTTGTANGTITSVSAASGSSVNVTVNSITGTGTLRLDLKASTNISDAAGNGNGTNGSVAAFTSGSAHTVDRDAPTVTIQGAPASVSTTSAFGITLQFSEAVTGFSGVGDVTATNAAVGAISATDGDTYTVSITPNGGGDIKMNVPASAAQDAAGNASTAATEVTVTFVTSPEINVKNGTTSITDGGADAQGSVAAGVEHTITYTVENTGNAGLTLVTATSSSLSNVGTPTIASLSSPVAATGSTTFTVKYTPIASSAFSFHISMVNNDSDENPYNWTVSGTATNDAPTVTDGNISISGASGTAGTFKIGDTVTATWNNTAGGDGNTDIASVSVDFSAFGGGTAVAATDSSDTWSATHTITAGTIDATNLNISLRATDNGSPALSTAAADTTNATLDNQAPVLTDGNLSLSGGSGVGGAFRIGDTVTATWNNTAGGDNNIDIAGVTFNFSDFGGGAAVAGGNSSGTWTATYAIAATPASTSSLNISATATDDAGNATTAADTTNATFGVNANPTVSSLPTDLTATEDTLSNVALGAAVFADADSSALTVTLTASAGTFATPAAGGAAVTVTLVNPTVITLVGTPAGINTYLDTASNIQYTGAANVSGNDAATITVVANDGDGSGDMTLGIVNLDLSEVDDATTLMGLPTSLAAAENTQGDLSLAAATFADIDSASITITISVGAGTLTPAASASAPTVAGSGTSFTLTGSPAEINTYLDTASNVKYSPPASSTASQTFTVAAGSTTLGTATINVTPGAPEINLKNGTVDLADAGTDAQGAVAAGVERTITYTVENTGNATLTVSAPTHSSLTNVGTPTIAAVSSPIAAAGSTTFTVKYTPSADGGFSFDLSMVNDDSDENPYSWTVSGTATNAVPTLSAAPSPADDTTDVGVDSDIVLRFSEAILAGTGSITLEAGSAGGTDISIDITNASKAVFSGSTLTLKPGALTSEETYTVLIPATAIVDGLGASFAGLTASDTVTAASITSGYQFTVASVSPAIENDAQLTAATYSSFKQRFNAMETIQGYIGSRVSERISGSVVYRAVDGALNLQRWVSIQVSSISDTGPMGGDGLFAALIGGQDLYSTNETVAGVFGGIERGTWSYDNGGSAARTGLSIGAYSGRNFDGVTLTGTTAITRIISKLRDETGATARLESLRGEVSLGISGTREFESGAVVTPYASVFYVTEDIPAFTYSSGTTVAASTSSLGQVTLGIEYTTREYDFGRITLGGSADGTFGTEPVTLSNGKTLDPTQQVTGTVTIGWQSPQINDTRQSVSVSVSDIGDDDRTEVRVDANWERDY